MKERIVKVTLTYPGGREVVVDLNSPLGEDVISRLEEMFQTNEDEKLLKLFERAVKALEAIAK